MPVRRDQHGRWFFRTTVKKPDGTKERIAGWPGTPGPYQDLARTQVGAKAAEDRAKAHALLGKPMVAALEPPKEVKTFREHAKTFLELYLPEQKPSERRTKTWIIENSLLPHFGDMTIEQLEQTDVDAYSGAELRRGMAIKSVSNRLAVLSTLIRYVTGEKAKLRLCLKGMAAEIAAVSVEDIERLLGAATDDRYRVVVLLAAEAGLRAGEIRGLQWTDIKDGQLTVRRAIDNATDQVIAPKHNKARTVPLSPRLAGALASLQRRGLWVVSRLDGGLLSYNGLNKGICELYDRAGVTHPPKVIHCLRHSFGTMMARKVSLSTLQELMGHSNVQTTRRYIHVNEADKRDAIALVFGSVAATRHQDAKGAGK